MDAAIVQLDVAERALVEVRRALSESSSIEEVLEIRDKAEAIRAYLKQRGVGLDTQNVGAEMKLRAERRLGELLRQTPKHPGARAGNDETRLQTATAFRDIGIEKTQAHRCQRIAGLPEQDFEQHIAEVRQAGQELTTAGVLRLARERLQPGKREEPQLVTGCTSEDLQALAEGGMRFGTIMADPPWQYSNQATRAATDNHYRTMTVEEICRLPVGQLAADCCHLHLWTTNAFLFECPRIFAAWGFVYQGLFVWCKPQMGIGNCWRVSHELMLLAIRGEPRSFLDHSLTSWASLDRGKHSAKPEQVRLMVEKASPGPRLELFGRRPAEGWLVWGDNIDKDLFYQQQKLEVAG